jgi:S1-C subfamily serine protease
VGQAVTSGIAKAQEDARNAPPDAATAYRTIAPSLVSVTTTLPPDATHPKPVKVAGSGVVVRQDGTIVTALHVVVSGPIQVTFADGTVATGRIAGQHERVGLVRVGRAYGPHLVQHHRHAALGDLPGRLGAGEATAHDMNRCGSHGRLV